MLTYPTGFPFIPNLYMFTNYFSLLDNEEVDEEDYIIEFQKYDPINSDNDLLQIVELQLGALDYILQMSYKHAFAAVQCLDNGLKNEDDLSVYFKDCISVEPYDSPEYEDTVFYPWHLNNERAKEYFELLLSRLKVEWKDAIEKASKEDPSTW